MSETKDSPEWTAADSEAFLSTLQNAAVLRDWSASQNPHVQELYALGWTLAVKIERDQIMMYAWRNTVLRRDETPEFVCSIDGPGDVLDRILIAVLECAKSVGLSENIKRSMRYTETPVHACGTCKHLQTELCPEGEKGTDEHTCHHPFAAKPFPVIPSGRCPHHETKSSS